MAAVAQQSSLELLSKWIASNPNRHKGLDMLHTSTAEARFCPNIVETCHAFLPGNATNWIEYNVSPHGPITALYFLKDPFFAEAPHVLRNQMQLEKRIELTQKIDNDMRSGKLMRMRRKMHEWLAADMSRLTAETRADVWDILCTVYNIQTICVEESLGNPLKITFAPENPMLWQKDLPIFIVEKNLTKVWNYAGNPLDLRKSLSKWISDMEQANADIVYPIADMSKVDMIDFLEVLPSWKESMRKLKKDELAPIVGRAKVLELFDEWSQMNQIAIF